MENKLLPCPFCGGEAYLDISQPAGDETEYFTVVCRCCAAEGPWFNVKGSAVAAWNRREDAK